MKASNWILLFLIVWISIDIFSITKSTLSINEFSQYLTNETYALDKEIAYRQLSLKNRIHLETGIQKKYSSKVLPLCEEPPEDLYLKAPEYLDEKDIQFLYKDQTNLIQHNNNSFINDNLLYEFGNRLKSRELIDYGFERTVKNCGTSGHFGIIKSVDKDSIYIGSIVKSNYQMKCLIGFNGGPQSDWDDYYQYSLKITNPIKINASLIFMNESEEKIDTINFNRELFITK